MCKVIAFSNATKLDLKKTANVCGPLLLKTESDGFGYAVQGDKGQFGEKYVGERFRSRLTNWNRAVKLPFVKHEYEFFGTRGKVTGPAIFHGRTSTNDAGLTNCHPMRRDGWSLIHNGVVTDHGTPYVKLTSNDSEDVLARLIEGIASVEANLTGYYAFAAIDPSGILHIARDTHATLHAAWSDVAETYIFATTPELIEHVSLKLELKVGPIDAVQDDVYMTLSGNELTHMQDIKPRGFERRESMWASQSLGRELEGTSSTYAPSSDLELDETRFNRYESEGWPEISAESEEAYYSYREELDNVDPSYEIYDADGKIIQVAEFKRMDHISQERCQVYRYDGTLVAPDSESERQYA